MNSDNNHNDRLPSSDVDMQGVHFINHRGFILRGLKSNFGADRTNDDVHSSIKICSVTREVLDTPQMQRLRGLKQLGTSEMTYITTTHSRFEHSLGVANLAEKMLRQIKSYQPQLGVSEKDILCVKLAGLLHDLGHGPFSHVFDSEFFHLLRRAQKEGEWLGQKFNPIIYDQYPHVVDGWVHEDASLMMVDALLEHLGLQIDPEHLDAPLKQIGSGIRAECFGICEPLEEDGASFYDGKTSLPSNRVLTSRDWIFIKECILGGPLPINGLSIKASEELLFSSYDQNSEAKMSASTNYYVVGRPDPLKEWLYTIVSNRFSGFDVDKLDYYARDARRAFSTSAGVVDPLFIENAMVAWGTCERPKKCFRCQYHGRKFGTNFNENNMEDRITYQKPSSLYSSSILPFRPSSIKHAPEAPSSTYHYGRHLMICFPEKMVVNAMDFFRERFRNHQYLYTHGNSKAVEYMICDVLLLSDQHFRISCLDEGDGCGYPPSNQNRRSTNLLRLPISRAMTHPQAYLKLKDSIIDLIANTEDVQLRPARELINRIRSRKLYKRVGKVEIHCSDGKENIDVEWQKRLWDMKDLDIASDIVKCGQLRDSTIQLRPDDIIVEKRQIHHGMKEENPVRSMRFIRKSQLSGLREIPEKLPEATIVSEEDYWCVIPRAFLQKTVRVYCRAYGKEDYVTTCYYQFLEKMKKDYGFERLAVENGDDKPASADPVLLSQSPVIYNTLTDNKRGHDDDAIVDRSLKYRKLFLDGEDSP